MDINLLSESGQQFRFSPLVWRYVTEFAAAHGFKWPSDARGDDCSSLTAAEAKSLGKALERGIGKAPADQVIERVRSELAKRLEIETSTLNDFSAKIDAKAINSWREFVQFTQGGGFSMTF